MAFCPKCGASLNEGVKFCQSCGANLQKSATPTQQQAQPPTQPQPEYAKPVKKSKTPLIIGIVVAVVAIVIILLLVLLFTGGLGGEEGKFVGTWEYSIDMGDFGDYSVYYKFNSDKTLEAGFSASAITKIGSWKIEGDKIVMSSSGAGSEFETGSFNYKFSNNDNKLTLSMGSVDVMTFTKVGSSSGGSGSNGNDDGDSGDDNGNGDDGGDNGGSGYIDTELVGTWEYSAYEMTMSYIFKSDGSFDISYMGHTSETGTWSTSGDQLCLTYSGSDAYYTYSISGNQLTLSSNAVSYTHLTLPTN